MKKLLGLMAIAVLMGIGAALAQGTFGLILTSPVVVSGSLNYNAGPQMSGIAANGGTFTANGASSVVVANTNVTANSVIVFGLKTVGGTPAPPFVFAVTAGTSFTIRSTAGDTSVYNYWILG